MVILLVFAFGLLGSATEAPLPAPTFAGMLPVGVESGFAARLDSTHGQHLMSSRDGMLVAFVFEQGSFVPKCSLPLPAPIAAPNGGSPLATGNIAAAGDVDGDGLDELVVGGTRTLRKYELVNGAFALTAMVSAHYDSGSPPQWASDVCVGDVDNDGVNEVLITGVDSLTSYATGDYRGRTTLFLCRWADDKLSWIWNDRGALELEGPSWVMPITEMRCVCDPTNLGRPRLLMKEGASDVSAGLYDELQWASGGLVREGHFVITNGRIQRNVPDDPQNSAIGCDFAQAGGVTAVLASILREEEDTWQGEYLVFSGDTATMHRVVWSDNDHDWYSPSRGILIDLDGKGTGALRLMYSRDHGLSFEFYRL